MSQTIFGTLLVMAPVDMFKMAVPLDGLEHAGFDRFHDKRLRNQVQVLTNLLDFSIATLLFTLYTLYGSYFTLYYIMTTSLPISIDDCCSSSSAFHVTGSLILTL